MQKLSPFVFNNGLREVASGELIFGRYTAALLFCTRRAGRVVDCGSLENC